MLCNGRVARMAAIFPFKFCRAILGGWAAEPSQDGSSYDDFFSNGFHKNTLLLGGGVQQSRGVGVFSHPGQMAIFSGTLTIFFFYIFMSSKLFYYRNSFLWLLIYILFFIVLIISILILKLAFLNMKQNIKYIDNIK